MRFTTFALLLALIIMPMASLAFENKTVVEAYQEAIQKLEAEYQKLKRLTAAAKQKVAELEDEANSIKTLIAEYQTALETTTQVLVSKNEVQLEAVTEAYQKKLAVEADLAEMARHSAQDDANATRAILDELGTSAEKVAKLTDAVSVSSDGKVGVGTTAP